MTSGAKPFYQKMRRRASHVGWLVSERTKHLTRRIPDAQTRRLATAMSRAQVVSFDVFDTALFRCVPEPADVFEVVAIRLQSQTALGVSPLQFRDARVAAEASARRRLWREERAEEVTLVQIYEELARLVPALDADRALNVELATERATCVVNPDVKKLYARLVQERRRIIFISDTYFPKSFVAELLLAAGYDGPHELHTSSEYAATKERGTLFRCVADVIGVPTSAIVHLGDNRRPDVAAARRMGVDGYWYRKRPRPIHAVPSDGSLADKIVTRLEALSDLDDFTTPQDRMFRDLGYALAGPLFLGLTQWLVEQLQQEPAQLMLFCARDGAFVQRIYDLAAASVPLPPSRYLEVSRRSLAFPSFETLDATNLDMLSANFATIPTRDFFSRLGINIEDYPGELRTVGLTPTTLIHSYMASERLQIQDLFKLLESVVLARSASERPLLLEYLDDVGCLRATSTALFDIGWGGTLQYALASVLRSAGATTKLCGYYLSTDERVARLVPHAGSALAWFANAGKPLGMHRLVQPAYWLLEVIFSAQHGTVLGYRRNATGVVEAVLHDYDAASANARVARSVQSAAYQFAERWIAIFDGIGPSIPMELAFAKYRRFVERPTHAEARFFGDLIHVGGLGDTRESQRIAAPPPLRKAIASPKYFLTEYRDTKWPIAFLQRVFRSNKAARAFLTVRASWRSLRAQIKPSPL